METGGSGTSSISLMDTPNGVEVATTRPTSAMQVSSSDEVFLAPGGNSSIAVLERPSPVPPIAMMPVSAVSSSSDAASAGGTQKNSATPVNSATLDPPCK